MSVVIKPHVDVRDGSFRGEIAPADVGSWFASYRVFLSHYADLAREARADAVVIGTEMTSMSAWSDEWRRVIADIRARFDGRLTYAANWIDGARRIDFWSELDYIGVDAYMPLTRAQDPSVETLAAAWCDSVASGSRRNYVAEVGALQEQYGKPVLFTELGYESRYGTAASPWGGATGAVGQEPQRRAYEAAFRIWSDTPWMTGIFWWDWPAAGTDAANGSYSPAGKSAQATLTAWNTGTEQASAQHCPRGTRRGRTARRAKAVVTLEARIKRRPSGRRVVKLFGKVRQKGVRCRGKVRVRLQKRSPSYRWRTSRRFASRTRAQGRYLLKRRLPRGRFRARTVTNGTCNRARSRYERFRVR